MSDLTKINTTHLSRLAYVYLRQSSAAQVEHNRESTARQYALVTKAAELGWPAQQVLVIDEDLGVSGSGVIERSGFARLTAEVALGFGRIVNITSINGMRGKFGQANYAAAKAGLIGLTKTAAREFGKKGITVNAVAPGMVVTDMARALPEEILARAVAEAALPELCDAQDISNAVLFLLSDAARSITGEVLRVDAGQYI
jgi:NAD(P)-dependent dehydrogenase (short-subunit alcohol dehydrogenase family)